MFKLMNIAIGRYAVVKKNENTSKTPASFHGYIEVIASSNENPCCVCYMQSDELKKSGEVENLKAEAIEMARKGFVDWLKR